VDCPDERVADYFAGRFGGGREEWIRQGIVGRLRDGEFSTGRQWVRIWTSVK